MQALPILYLCNGCGCEYSDGYTIPSTSEDGTFICPITKKKARLVEVATTNITTTTHSNIS